MGVRLVQRVLLVLGIAVAGVAVLAPPASAQATRTWVSGLGDDANPCSRTAPCKTWAGAISKTAVGGVINAMDDGGFGALTITKAITIDGGGHVASALTSGTNGINIVAPTNAQVVLRAIDIKGVNAAEGSCSGLSGVNVVGAASVRLDDVTIAGFQNAVSTPLTNSSPDAYVDMSFNDVSVNDNCAYGLRIAPDAGHLGRATIDGTTITGSNVALSVAAGGEAWVSNSRVYLNNVGIEPVGTGRIHSLCNNQVAGNASDGAFTDDAHCGLPATTPASPAAPTTTTPASATATATTTATQYCAVPQLKKKTSAQAESLLAAAGCALGKVKKQSAPKAKRGKIVGQAVPAGTLVKLGTVVGVVVGK
jgi:PASTA domain-containing protein